MRALTPEFFEDLGHIGYNYKGIAKGDFVLTFDDGTTLEIPIIYGLNITNKSRVWDRIYRGVANRDAYKVDSLLVEVGYTALPMRDGCDTVFKIAVRNPFPEKKILSADIVKTCSDEGDIILKKLDCINP